MISVYMTSMTDEVSSGGSAITSYSLEWDEGTGVAFTPIIGYDSNNIVLTYTFDSLT
jgi:hypothetical protein